MKFLEILMSFLATQGKSFLQNNTEALTQHVVNNARKVAILVSFIVISITLFCSGFTMAYSGIVNVYAGQGSFSFSSHVVGGLILLAVAIIALTQCLSEKNWLRAVGVAPAPNLQQQPQQNAGPTIEMAVSVLILEIANELKERRTHDSKNQGQASQV